MKSLQRVGVAGLLWLGAMAVVRAEPCMLDPLGSTQTSYIKEGRQVPLRKLQKEQECEQVVLHSGSLAGLFDRAPILVAVTLNSPGESFKDRIPRGKPPAQKFWDRASAVLDGVVRQVPAGRRFGANPECDYFFPCETVLLPSSGLVVKPDPSRLQPPISVQIVNRNGAAISVTAAGSGFLVKSSELQREQSYKITIRGSNKTITQSFTVASESTERAIAADLSQIEGSMGSMPSLKRLTEVDYLQRQGMDFDAAMRARESAELYRQLFD